MAGDLDTLLLQFLRERKYLHNLRPQTLEWYETARKAFRKSATSCLTDPASLKRAHLEAFIYALRDRGVKPLTCNTWLRTLNAFRQLGRIFTDTTAVLCVGMVLSLDAEDWKPTAFARIRVMPRKRAGRATRQVRTW